MRFNFDIVQEPNKEENRSITPLTPTDEVEWLPLQEHPLFTSTTASRLRSKEGDGEVTTHRTSRNLLAWDGDSRLYFWDSDKRCLHRISLRLGEPDCSSVLAASPSKVLIADVQLNFEVNNISINKNGSALLLVGSEGLYVMHLYGRTSANDNTIKCRTVPVGSQIYLTDNNFIRTLQVIWHPYSHNHLGVLSSDSVFRLFDISSDLKRPEQEYYLQPVELGRLQNASSICPVDFSFGVDHLWDRFSVFILFSDGTIYILCPVVPFGSVYLWESILEIYSDAQTFGLKSTNSTAVSNSSMAISWLEATFPELSHQETEGKNVTAVKVHPYSLFDASLALQGPLHPVGDVSIQGAKCEGPAVGFLYSFVNKDSILVTAWSGGQIQIDALADEIQPLWILDSPPRLRVDSHHNILGLAMICESIPSQRDLVKLDQPIDHTAWVGHPPPLLRLAIVDLALPKSAKCGSNISVFVDALIPERIYALHDGGVDSIVLHFLPFTSQFQGRGKEVTAKTPSVNSVLTSYPNGDTPALCPIHGFVTLFDSFGYSWIVAVTSIRDCILIEMKSWNCLLPFNVGSEETTLSLEESTVTNPPDIISKELLIGPKPVLLPQASSSFPSIAVDSIEGRSALHQYCKLFHENYVEYAHKVYFELKHHGPQLKRIIEDQQARLIEAQQKILSVDEKQSNLDERLNRISNVHKTLEERLQHLRQLPGAHKRPLSRAEREFKSELDRYRGVELDALRSSIDALNARVRRHIQSPKGNSLNQQRQLSRRKNNMEDAHISQLQSSIAKLSLVNTENSKNVKLVESALKSRENNGLLL